MLLAGSLPLDDLLATLKATRPVFHSEADFQHALAWTAHQLDPRIQVRLETHPEPNVSLDLLLSRPDLGRNTAVELKYLTAAWAGLCDGEVFTLKSHGAQDIRAYDTLKDISRVERFIAARPGWSGLVLALTNDANYWQAPSHSRLTNADAFRLHEGNQLHGTRSWGPLTGNTKLKREADIVLDGNYRCGWQNYSVLSGQRGRFRILALEI